MSLIRTQEEPAKAPKTRLRRSRFGPPGPLVGDPRKWWDLTAASGLSGGASGEASTRLFKELNELPIFVTSDPAELRADQLRTASDREESSRLLGQHWRAAQESGGARHMQRSDPFAYIRNGWGAFQVAGAVAAESSESSEFGRIFPSLASEFGLTKEECDSLGPRATLRKVAWGRMFSRPD